MARATEGRTLRTCIASGVQKPKEEMVRFVIGPDAEIVPDLEEKLPGRGFWLSADRDMIHTACAKNLFSKKARRRVNTDGDLAARVEALLVRRCLDLLRLARRARQITAGFDDVCRQLASGAQSRGGGLLLTAADGGSSGRGKIRSLTENMPVDVLRSGVLTGDELGRIAERERIVHVLVAPGRLAERLAVELGRLAGIRPAQATAE